MIPYEDYYGAEGAVRELIDRRQVLADLENSKSKLEAFEELYHDAEDLGAVHFMATARWEQFNTYFETGNNAEAVRSYLQLFQIVAAQGEYVRPENIAYFLRSAPAFVHSLMQVPDIPLATVEAIVNQLEAPERLYGATMADVLLCRATIAAWLGDREETLRLLDQWQAEGDEHWSLADDGVSRLELGLVENVDLPLAIERLKARVSILDLDAGGRLYYRLVLASLLGQAGQAEEAAALVADVTLAELEDDEETPEVDRLRAVESRPDLAAAVAAKIVTTVNLTTPGHYPWVAAVARARLVADPDDEHGRTLARLAESHAAALDARNGTDAQRRALAERWWTGLPDPGAPAGPDKAEPTIDGAVVATLQNPVVEFWDAPYVLRDQYLAFASVGDITDAKSDEQAEALAAEMRSKARELRFTTGEVASDWMLSLYHIDGGDRLRGLELYLRLQETFESQADVLAGFLRDSYASSPHYVVADLVAHPGIEVQTLENMIDRQERYCQTHGAPQHPAAFARAVLAAHRGDEADMRAQQSEAMRRCEEEGGEEYMARTQVILATLRTDPQRAEALLAAVPAAMRKASELTEANLDVVEAYFAARRGDAQTAARLVERVLDAEHGDLSKLGLTAPLGCFVLGMEGSSRMPGLVEELDVFLHDALPGSWEGVAALGAVLKRRDPTDPRAAELLDEAARHAAALDARNGNSAASEQMRNLWL